MPRHCVIRHGALGDFILTLPMLQCLFETGQLSLACSPAHLALLPDGLIPCNRIDSNGLDIASIYTDTPSSNASAFIHGAIVHLFRKHDQVFEERLIKHGADKIIWHEPRPVSPPHASIRMIQEAELTPPDNLLETAFLHRGCDRGDALWIHSGSGSPNKNIAPETWAGLAADFLADNKTGLVVSFGEADLELIPSFKAAFASAALPFTPVICPPLRRLRHLLSTRAAFFWGADTGVTHLAAALGIPTTALFTTTNPDIWRPCGNVRTVRYHI